MPSVDTNLELLPIVDADADNNLELVPSMVDNDRNLEPMPAVAGFFSTHNLTMLNFLITQPRLLN